MTLTADAFREAMRPPCGVRTILEKLDPPERDVLADALADPAVTHSAIERVLKTEGRDISDTTIGTHRRGECSCAA